MWETDYEHLRQHWAAALDETTELWRREDRMTRERWRLWEERLRSLSREDGSLSAETRAVAMEAADVIGDILGEKPV